MKGVTYTTIKGVDCMTDQRLQETFVQGYTGKNSYGIKIKPKQPRKMDK